MVAGFPFAARRDSGERHESFPGTGWDNPGGKYPYLGFRRFLRSFALGVAPATMKKHHHFWGRCFGSKFGPFRNCSDQFVIRNF